MFAWFSWYGMRLMLKIFCCHPWQLLQIFCFWKQKCCPLTWSQIFCYLPSCPPGWECSIRRLSKAAITWRCTRSLWRFTVSHHTLSKMESIPSMLGISIHVVFASTLPDIKTGHDWDWNVEGHHTAEDWHELVCFDELDEAHALVQIGLALNVGPGVDGGHPDDLVKIATKKRCKKIRKFTVERPQAERIMRAAIFVVLRAR